MTDDSVLSVSLMTIPEAEVYVATRMADKSCAYHGNAYGGNHSTEDVNKAVFEINFLMEKIAEGKPFDPSEWIRKYSEEQKQRMRDQYGDPMLGEDRSGEFGKRSRDDEGPILS